MGIIENESEDKVKKDENGEHFSVLQVNACSEDIDGIPVVAPDGGWGWFVVFGAFYIHVILGGFERANGVLYLELRERFGKGATDTAWVPALCTTMTYCVGPLVSVMCNRFSIRFVATVGSIFVIFGTFLSGFGPNLVFLYLSFGVIVGLGRSMLIVSCLISVGFYFDKRRGIAVGLASSGTGVGMFIFPPMLEYLFSEYGFKGAWIIQAAIAGNFLISATLFRPLQLSGRLINRNRKRWLKENIEIDTDTALLRKKENNGVFQNTQENKSQRKQFLKQIFINLYDIIKNSEYNDNKSSKSILQLSLFKNYAFSAFCLQTLLFSTSFLLTLVFLPALTQSRGLTETQGAYVLSILGAFDAVARIAISTMLDLKRIKKFRLIIFNIFMIIIGVFTILILHSHNFWQFAIISALYGMTAGTQVSQKSVIVVDILGIKKLSSSLGLIMVFQGVGCLIGPILGGLLRDSFGSYDMSFYTGSIGIFIGAVVFASGNIWLHMKSKTKQ